MAGFRLAPVAARARRNPWQRRRRWTATTPVPVSLGSLASTATATGDLGVSVNGQLPVAPSNAVAAGTLALTATAAVGSRAAPGWLGLYILDDTSPGFPTINGGSNSVATGSLSLLTPSARLISGNSRAFATGSVTFVVGPGGGYLMGTTDGVIASFNSSGNMESFDTTGDFELVVPLPV